jgi:hypothetical protein
MAAQDDAFYKYGEAVLRYNYYVLYGRLPDEDVPTAWWLFCVA